MGPQITASFGTGNSVGSTQTNFALTPASTNTLPNLLVVGFDLYTPDPSAYFHAQVQRVESYTEDGTTGATNSPRASLTTRDRRPAFVSDTNGIHRISDHAFNANCSVEFRFPEPLEIKKDWQSSNDHYFVIAIQRQDDEAPAKVYLNVYYSEY